MRQRPLYVYYINALQQCQAGALIFVKKGGEKMTEWGVVGVLVAVVGLIVTVAGPMI